MPLSRPWIPLSRSFGSFRFSITLRCSDLILSPLSYHPFLYSSHLDCQRILTTGGIRFSRCPDKCKEMEKFRRSNISMDIKITEHLAKGNKEWKEIVPEAYHGFTKAFEEGQYNKLPEHRIWDHKIDFKEGTDLNKLQCRIYPLTKQEEEEMNKFIDENLESGRIRVSQSQIVSPFFFVKKKTADLRPVQNYIKVNDATIKD